MAQKWYCDVCGCLILDDADCEHGITGGRMDPVRDLYAEGDAAGYARAIAEVVAWLHREAGIGPVIRRFALFAADTFERGEHVPKEE